MTVVISEKASFSLHVKVRVGCVSVQYHTYRIQSKGYKGRRWFQSPLICLIVDQIHASDQNPMLDQLMPNFTKVNDGVHYQRVAKLNVMTGRSLMTVSFLWDRISCSPDYPWIHYILKEDHEFLISPHPPPSAGIMDLCHDAQLLLTVLVILWNTGLFYSPRASLAHTSTTVTFP